MLRVLHRGSVAAWTLAVLLALFWGRGGETLLVPSQPSHKRRNPAGIPLFRDQAGIGEEDGSRRSALLAGAQSDRDPGNCGVVGADYAGWNRIRDRGIVRGESPPILGRLSLRGGHEKVPPPKIRRPHRMRRSQTRKAKMEEEVDEGGDGGEGASTSDGEGGGEAYVPAQEVEGMLSRLLAPDTSTVRSAEHEANSKMESVSFSTTLLGIALDESARLELRQMAASMLKRSLPAVWERMPSAKRSEVLEMVAASVMSDATTVALRRQMAVILGALTPLADSFMKLHGVVKSALEACRSEDVSKREVSLGLVQTLLSSIGIDMRPFAPEIFSACATSLVDVSSEVQRAAISLACYAIQRFDDPNNMNLHSIVLKPLHGGKISARAPWLCNRYMRRRASGVRGFGAHGGGIF